MSSPCSFEWFAVENGRNLTAQFLPLYGNKAFSIYRWDAGTKVFVEYS
jgi:hypothetical protein